jgi:KDO2-lipid IV(A) lauroyltransferase
VVEGIKGLSMSMEEAWKRHKVMNPEVARDLAKKYGGVLGCGAHYTNWEWGFSGGEQIETASYCIYKPLNNKYLDKWVRDKRNHNKMEFISIKETSSHFANTAHKNEAHLLLGDQSPSNIKEAIWVNFLGQDTACLHGLEKYAHLYNYPVLYLQFQRVKRGYYELRFFLVTENPKETPENYITQRFMQYLEQDILKDPTGWLWSHRRWKHTR